MKQHLEDDDLILHFYGETGSAAEPHLADCPDCRSRYQGLQRVMNSIESEAIPYRGSDYESEVWSRLEPRLGRKRWWSVWLAPQRWIPVMAAAAILIAVFFAGRYTEKAVQPPVVAKANPQVKERVLLVAVGDHLERSEMLLVEIANADPKRPINLSSERDEAQDLVSANRLYRQTAMTSGDGRVVSLLDDLERVLVEIAHSPEDLRGARLQQLRERIESEGLIFKIRVAGSRLVAQEDTL